jgi:hypothetical protein
MNSINILAVRILNVYYTDSYIKGLVDASPEMYRALIYETEIIADPIELDGTEEYDLLVNELERILD